MINKIIEVEWELIQFKKRAPAAWADILDKHFVCRDIIAQVEHDGRQRYIAELEAKGPRTSFFSFETAAAQASIRSDHDLMIQRFKADLAKTVIYSKAIASESSLELPDRGRIIRGLKGSFVDFAVEFLKDYSGWMRLIHPRRSHSTEAGVLAGALNRAKLDETKGFNDIEALVDAEIRIAGAKPGGSFDRRAAFLKELLATLKAIEVGLRPIVEAAPELAPTSAFA